MSSCVTSRGPSGSLLAMAGTSLLAVECGDVRGALFLFVAAAMILCGEEPFPMDKGTEWTYAGKMQWDQDGKPMERRMTWVMRVEKRETQGDVDIATIVGWPGDLAFFSEDRKPSTWLLVRKGSQYFQTVSPLDVRTLNPDT